MRKKIIADLSTVVDKYNSMVSICKEDIILHVKQDKVTMEAMDAATRKLEALLLREPVFDLNDANVLTVRVPAGIGVRVRVRGRA